MTDARSIKDPVIIFNSPGDDIEEIRSSYPVGTLRSGRMRCPESDEERDVVDLTTETYVVEDNNAHEIILLDSPPPRAYLSPFRLPRAPVIRNRGSHPRQRRTTLLPSPTSRRRSRVSLPEVIEVERDVPRHSSNSDNRPDTDVILVNQNATPGVTVQPPEGGLESLTPNRKLIRCPICMDHERTIHRTGRQLNSTTCGHIFCSGCLNQLFTQTGPKQCPTCRKKLTKKSFHPLFV